MIEENDEAPSHKQFIDDCCDIYNTTELSELKDNAIWFLNKQIQTLKTNFDVETDVNFFDDDENNETKKEIKDLERLRNAFVNIESLGENSLNDFYYQAEEIRDRNYSFLKNSWPQLDVETAKAYCEQIFDYYLITLVLFEYCNGKTSINK
jgi:hypothetical protein